MSAQLTRFRLLVLEHGWNNWPIFAAHFDRVAREAALAYDRPDLASATVARRTFDRWMNGDPGATPSADTQVVLERLLGTPCAELFAPRTASHAAGAMGDRGS